MKSPLRVTQNALVTFVRTATVAWAILASLSTSLVAQNLVDRSSSHEHVEAAWQLEMEHLVRAIRENEKNEVKQLLVSSRQLAKRLATEFDAWQPAYETFVGQSEYFFATGQFLHAEKYLDSSMKLVTSGRAAGDIEKISISQAMCKNRLRKVDEALHILLPIVDRQRDRGENPQVIFLLLNEVLIAHTEKRDALAAQRTAAEMIDCQIQLEEPHSAQLTLALMRHCQASRLLDRKRDCQTSIRRLAKLVDQQGVAVSLVQQVATSALELATWADDTESAAVFAAHVRQEPLQGASLAK